MHGNVVGVTDDVDHVGTAADERRDPDQFLALTGLEFRLAHVEEKIAGQDQIGGAALTSSTIGLSQTVALNNTANAETDIIALAQNGLVLATQANPYLTPIPVPVAAQTWRTTKFAEYVIEWNLVTPASTTGTLYGVFVDCFFNYL